MIAYLAAGAALLAVIAAAVWNQPDPDNPPEPHPEPATPATPFDASHDPALAFDEPVLGDALPLWYGRLLVQSGMPVQDAGAEALRFDAYLDGRVAS